MLFTKKLKVMADRVSAVADKVLGLLDRYESQGYVEFDVDVLDVQGLGVRVKLPKPREEEGER